MSNTATPIYAVDFTEPRVRALIERIIRSAKKWGAAFDVDQTFTVENPNPWVKMLQPEVLRLWAKLAEWLGFVAVVTRADWKECEWLFSPQAGGSPRIHYCGCSGQWYLPPGATEPIFNSDAEWLQVPAHDFCQEWEPTLRGHGIDLMQKLGGYGLRHNPGDARAAEMMRRFLAIADRYFDVSHEVGVAELTTPGLVFDKAGPVLKLIREHEVDGMLITGDSRSDWRMVKMARALARHPEHPLSEVVATSVGTAYPEISATSDLILPNTAAAVLFLQELVAAGNAAA
jgi:hypothetical protein